MKEGSEEKVNAAAPSAEGAAPEGGEQKKCCRCRRIIRRVLIITAIVVVALVLFVWLLLGHALRVGICKAGPVFTGTPIQMLSLVIDPFEGRVLMHDFTVGNPEGFSHDNIFEMGSLVCDLDMSTLTSDELVIEEITIRGLMVDYEPSITRGSNVKVLQQNIESKIGKAGEKKDEKEEKSDKPAKKVVIKELRVEGIELATAGGIRMPLPPIVMSDLGGGESIGETIDTFLTELLLSVGKVFSQETLKSLGSGLSDAGGAVGDSVGSAGKAIGDAVGGLFSGDEKK